MGFLGPLLESTSPRYLPSLDLPVAFVDSQRRASLEKDSREQGIVWFFIHGLGLGIAVSSTESLPESGSIPTGLEHVDPSPAA